MDRVRKMSTRWISLVSGLVTLLTVLLVLYQGQFSWRLKGGSTSPPVDRTGQPLLFWSCVIGMALLAAYSIFFFRPQRRSSDDEKPRSE